jgi:hypothetical protein
LTPRKTRLGEPGEGLMIIGNSDSD